FASRAVTVIVEVPVPASIVGGAAATVDCAAETAPLVTVTVAVWVTATPLIVAEIDCPPATAERSLPATVPSAQVGAVVRVSVFPVPVVCSWSVAPALRFPFASRAVTVIVEIPVPASIVGGAAATVDCAAETAPLVTVTVAVWVTATPLIV